MFRPIKAKPNRPTFSKTLKVCNPPLPMCSWSAFASWAFDETSQRMQLKKYNNFLVQSNNLEPQKQIWKSELNHWETETFHFHPQRTVETWHENHSFSNVIEDTLFSHATIWLIFFRLQRMREGLEQLIREKLQLFREIYQHFWALIYLQRLQSSSITLSTICFEHSSVTSPIEGQCGKTERTSRFQLFHDNAFIFTWLDVFVFPSFWRMISHSSFIIKVSSAHFWNLYLTRSLVIDLFQKYSKLYLVVWMEVWVSFLEKRNFTFFTLLMKSHHKKLYYLSPWTIIFLNEP